MPFTFYYISIIIKDRYCYELCYRAYVDHGVAATTALHGVATTTVAATTTATEQQQQHTE